MGARRFAGRLAALAVSAVAALGIAGALGVSAASASTATGPVTATTSVTSHPDTTAISGGACNSGITPNGPVWAFDNFTSQFSVVADANPANTYEVTITDTGTYAGFADPTTCAPLDSTGSLNGTYDLAVTSATPPSAAGLKASYNGNVSTTQMVQDLFGDKATSVVGGDYNFSYQGGNYVQNTAGQTGDVKAVACTVTITNPGNQANVLGDKVSLQLKATSNYPGTIGFDPQNLPHGLSSTLAGLITGTVDRTGSNIVTVLSANLTPPFGGETEAGPTCSGTVKFNWTVTATAPSPSPSPSSSPAGGSGSGSGSNGLPTGGVQTGAVAPGVNPLVPTGIAVAVIGLLAGSVYTLRRRHARHSA